MLIKKIKKHKMLSKVFLLSAFTVAIMLLIGSSYQLHSTADDVVINSGEEWHVMNATSWTIFVRDFDTGDQAPIPPAQTVTIARGSSGKLLVNSTADQFTFTSSASWVSIQEPFKGQLALRADEKVCCPQDYIPQKGHCNYCSDCDEPKISDCPDCD